MYSVTKSYVTLSLLLFPIPVIRHPVTSNSNGHYRYSNIPGSVTPLPSNGALKRHHTYIFTLYLLNGQLAK